MRRSKQKQAACDNAGAEEGVFLRWADLPLVLQHAVGAAALNITQQEQQQRRLRVQNQSTDQPRFKINFVRLGCRSLRAGVDAARTRLKVKLQAQQEHENRLQMLPMPVDAARFRGLRRLEISLRSDPDVRSSVHLEGPPSWLHEVHITGSRHVKLLSLPPGASMPQLHTLELEQLSLLPTFDCAQFAGLQRLELIECPGLVQLVNLASCSSLRVLETSGCPDLVSGLESDTLAQLQQLEQMVINKTQTSALDMAALSPSLTYLNVRGSKNGSVKVALPTGAPRTGLRHLGLRGTTQLQDWDLSSVPNLETLDISDNTQLPPVLELTGVPHLKRLGAEDAELRALHLSAARSSLVSLDVSCTPLLTLDLTGCTALTQLDCSSANRLRTLDLTPVCASLTKLTATACRQLEHIQVAGCKALQQLDLFDSTALADLDLRGCVSLKELSMALSRVQFVNVGPCAALEQVTVHPRQVVVNAGSRVRIETL